MTDAAVIGALFERYELKILGTTDADDLPSEEAEYNEWLGRGFHGTMSYMETHARAKFRPGNVLEDCRTLVFTGLNYFQPRTESKAGHGLVAMYAWGRDYHKVLGKRLKRIAKELRERYPTERFLAFTDATPIAERTFAAKAGIGFIGRNTLLIRKGLGSFFVLGGIATTMDNTHFEAEQVGAGPGFGNDGCPSGCRRCIEACPTGALYDAHRIDATRCISYLTIEHKGAIPAELRGKMGSWVFGCDVCQDVCPFNKMSEKSFVADFLSPYASESILIAEILTIANAKQFTDRFAGSPVMRPKLSGMLRNACIAAANLGRSDLLPLLEKLSHHVDPVVRSHAQWAKERLTEGPHENPQL